jgi:hypothetical protein
VGKSGYAAFWQDQDHMRRMDRMDADATNVTPKILMEQIKDYNWTVDEILAGAPAYDKRQLENKKPKSEVNELSIQDIAEPHQAIKMEKPGQWITEGNFINTMPYSTQRITRPRSPTNIMS